uniref:LAM_G_DOMAIN domain-containing protein n=1 Tax=Macrostomum lignano TaxID=282301 RepID=A0A1I8F6P6_9PLAT
PLQSRHGGLAAKRRRLAKEPWHQIYVDFGAAKHRRALIEPGDPGWRPVRSEHRAGHPDDAEKRFTFAGVANCTPEAARDEGQRVHRNRDEVSIRLKLRLANDWPILKLRNYDLKPIASCYCVVRQAGGGIKIKGVAYESPAGSGALHPRDRLTAVETQSNSGVLDDGQRCWESSRPGPR